MRVRTRTPVSLVQFLEELLNAVATVEPLGGIRAAACQMRLRESGCGNRVASVVSYEVDLDLNVSTAFHEELA